MWIHETGFYLQIGRAQIDPSAAPTRCRIEIPNAVAKLDPFLVRNKVRRMATAADYLWLRLYAKAVEIKADQPLKPSSVVGETSTKTLKSGDVHIMEQ